ncbi:hypothetical protein [Ancylobacter sp.]|uniref:hypothetical protein n=1 Tax=Ancylobacter sp. TaxID=1872567 RepID=UPI003D0B1C11
MIWALKCRTGSCVIAAGIMLSSISWSQAADEFSISSKEGAELILNGKGKTIEFALEAATDISDARGRRQASALIADPLLAEMAGSINAAHGEYQTYRYGIKGMQGGIKITAALMAGPLGLAATSVMDPAFNALNKAVYEKYVEVQGKEIRAAIGAGSIRGSEAAENYYREARLAEERRQYARAAELRERGAQELVKSENFIRQAGSTVVCKSLSPDACEALTRATVRAHFRLPIGETLLDLQRQATAARAGLEEVKAAFADFAKRTDGRLDALEQSYDALIIEVGIIRVDLDRVRSTVDVHAQQIDYLQHAAWRNMSAREKQEALRSGGFFLGMQNRDELEEQVKVQARMEALQEKAKFGEAVAGLANALARANIIDAELAKAISTVSFALSFSTQVANFAASAAFTSIGSWTSAVGMATTLVNAFGNAGPTQEQVMMGRIMQALGLINEKLDRILHQQQLALQGIMRLSEQIDALDRKINERLDRISAKIDYVTDVVTSGLLDPQADACQRFMRSGTAIYGLNLNRLSYRNFEARYRHWNEQAADRDLCISYVTQSTTVFRTGVPSLHAALIKSPRSNSAQAEAMDRSRRFIRRQIAAVYGLTDDSESCFDPVIGYLSLGLSNFSETRPLFDYLRNLERTGCASPPSANSLPKFLSRTDSGNLSPARWRLFENEVRPEAVAVSLTAGLLLAQDKSILVKDGGAERLASLKEMRERNDDYFIGRLREFDDLSRMGDLLDVTYVQNGIQSGLPLLTFLEDAMSVGQYGRSQLLGEGWRETVRRWDAYELSSVVQDLRKKQKAIAEKRAALAPKLFDSRGERRSAELDRLIKEVSTLDADEKAVNDRLRTLRGHEDKDDEIEGLKPVGKAIADMARSFDFDPNEIRLERRADSIGCPEVDEGIAISRWKPLYRYALASCIIEKYPLIAQNFWRFMALRQLTEGAYSVADIKERDRFFEPDPRSRVVCGPLYDPTFDERVAGDKCYAFDGEGGNRRGVSRISLEAALAQPSPSLLKRLFPDFDIVGRPVPDASKNADRTGPFSQWFVVWRSWDGRRVETPLPEIEAMIGKGPLSAPIAMPESASMLDQLASKIDERITRRAWMQEFLEQGSSQSRQARAKFIFDIYSSVR